ncbi:hypothetical protein K501DRAFT_333440 [Backusella circina FSU 941]|nr:hypothetical protein K501DRAFT_333440 [Backusella circina FSU 941]
MSHRYPRPLVYPQIPIADLVFNETSPSRKASSRQNHVHNSSHTCKQDKSSLGFFGVPIHLPPERFDSFKLAVAALNEPFVHPSKLAVEITVPVHTAFFTATRLNLTHTCRYSILQRMIFPCTQEANPLPPGIVQNCHYTLLKSPIGPNTKHPQHKDPISAVEIDSFQCCHVAVLLCCCVVALLLEKTDVARRIKRSTVVEHGSHSNKETQTLVDTRFFIFTSNYKQHRSRNHLQTVPRDESQRRPPGLNTSNAPGRRHTSPVKDLRS